MSISCKAILFYGYLQPEADKEYYYEADDGNETPWTETHTKRKHGCIGEIYGCDENLGHFLAVEESLQKITPWDGVKSLKISDLGAKSLDPSWNERLHQAASEFGIDLAGLQPSWHLACLYF